MTPVFRCFSKRLYCHSGRIQGIFFLVAILLCSCTKNTLVQKSDFIPTRIVSLSPAGTEILCAVGAFDKMVARSDFCDFPEYVKNLPSAGGFDGKSISIEKLLSFNPDFVYLTQGMHDYLVEILQKQGIFTYLSTANSVQGVLKEIEEIGKLTNNFQQAQEICKKITKDINSISEKRLTKNLEVPPKKVYWEVWPSPMMSVGNLSFINDLIFYSGGKNIFCDLNEFYPIVSEEAILFENPDVIFLSDSVDGAVEMIKARKAWQNVSAVKNDRIFAVNDDIINRPGPRIAESVRILSEKLYN